MNATPVEIGSHFILSGCTLFLLGLVIVFGPWGSICYPVVTRSGGVAPTAGENAAPIARRVAG